MISGWKQVLEDVRNTLLGEAPRDLAGEADAPEAQPATALSEDSRSGGQVATSAAPIDELPTVPTEQPALAEPSSPSPAAAANAPGGRLSIPDSHVLIGILLLAVGLWLAQATGWWTGWSGSKPPAPDVIATFEGGQLTLADMEAHLRQLTGEATTEPIRSPETMALVVEDRVMDELVKRWAAERKPDSDETFRHTMQHISEDLNLQSFEGQLHTEDIPVAESEIRAYYDANREQFGEQPLDAVRAQIRAQLVAEREQDYVDTYLAQLKDNASIARNFELLDVPSPSEDELRRYYEEHREQFRLPRQVVVDEAQFTVGADEAAARQDAADALLKLRAGASWADIASTISGAQVFTGTLVAAGTRDPAWDAAVGVLTEGELSDVFRAGDRLSIVHLQTRQESRVQSLEEVRPAVQAQVAAQVAADWFEANADKTLFTLKNTRYTVGEFYREYQELPPSVQAQYAGPAGMKALAERLIERLLLVEDANERLLDVENAPLVDEARLQVLKQMLHQEEVDDKIQVTEEEIQQYYEQNQAQLSPEPQARIRYIRIGLGNSEDEAARARQRADDAYQKLKPGLFQTGADFAEVAQEYSEDPETAANGGERPGWLGGAEGDPLTQLQEHAFADAVISLPLGEISPPFQFGDSFYIVQVIERTEPQPLSLEEARPIIEELLSQQKHEEQVMELQQQLLEGVNLQIYGSVLDDYFKELARSQPSR